MNSGSFLSLSIGSVHVVIFLFLTLTQVITVEPHSFWTQCNECFHVHWSFA